MSDAGAYDEERLGRLIGSLEPVPEGWVRAAQEIPAFRRTLDDLVARAEADKAFRDALVADLEAAVAEAGFEPEPRALEELRRRIDGAGQGS
jgi:hypothetical protein